MFRIPLPWPDTSVLLTPPLVGWHPILRGLAITLLCLTPLVLLVVLYRYELRIVPRLTAGSSSPLIGPRARAYPTRSASRLSVGGAIGSVSSARQPSSWDTGRQSCSNGAASQACRAPYLVQAASLASSFSPLFSCR